MIPMVPFPPLPQHPMFRVQFLTKTAIAGQGVLLQALIALAPSTDVVRQLVRNVGRVALNARFPMPVLGPLQVPLMTVHPTAGPVPVDVVAALFSVKLMAMTTPYPVLITVRMPPVQLVAARSRSLPARMLSPDPVLTRFPHEALPNDPLLKLFLLDIT